MPTYALFLRGINLVKHNRITMAELREVLRGAGFGDCQTHLQSGNVRLETIDADSDVAKTVEAALAGCGLKGVNVVAIPWNRLDELVRTVEWPRHDPAKQRPIAIFLRTPSAKAGELVGEYGPLTIVGAEPEVLFGLARIGEPRAFDVKRTVERPLGTPATVRFWSVLEAWVAKHG
jgi:uncharacterized protein (DUF1697 family)